MNKNYLKGVRKERKIKKEYENKGWVVLRTAGSHGFADLICVKHNPPYVLFIQCKPDNYSEKESEKILEKYKSVNGSKFVMYKVL